MRIGHAIYFVPELHAVCGLGIFVAADHLRCGLLLERHIALEVSARTSEKFGSQCRLHSLSLGGAEVLGALGILFGVLTQWAALGLILIMFGAIYMKAVKWRTGFWGEKSSGWHYDLTFVIINLVVLLTNGGRFTLSHWFFHLR
jgi:uncharacterized membrane protein YphA (DoxX/SURF4 family)